MEIKIKYFKGATPLKNDPKGDWIDMCAYEEVIVPPFEARKVPLGVAMELPKGYEAHLKVRSSTFKNLHCLQTNAVGTIDNSYCGDNDQWMIELFNPTNKLTLVSRGEKICQFRIVEKMPAIKFESVKRLGNSDRCGFGSTGR